jgi:hypothetical protein
MSRPQLGQRGAASGRRGGALFGNVLKSNLMPAFCTAARESANHSLHTAL